MNFFSQFKWNKDSFMILILAGVLLFIIVLPSDNGTEAEDEADNKTIAQSYQKESLSSLEQGGVKGGEKTYVEIMEDKLEEAIQYIEGVGLTKVIITLSSSSEIVVEKDVDMDRSSTLEKDEQGGEREMVDYKNYEGTVYATSKEGNQEPYVVKTILPNVEGVVVICQGGGSKTVAKNLTDVIQALFGVGPHKIKVVKMKS